MDISISEAKYAELVWQAYFKIMEQKGFVFENTQHDLNVALEMVRVYLKRMSISVC